METPRYEFLTVNVSLIKNTTVGQQRNFSIPSGKVVAMGCVVAGDTENRIIDLSILNNGTEVVRPADYRFSEKTNGGDFISSLRPVDFDGGREYEVQFAANQASVGVDLNFQVLLVVQKPNSY